MKLRWRFARVICSFPAIAAFTLFGAEAGAYAGIACITAVCGESGEFDAWGLYGPYYRER